MNYKILYFGLKSNLICLVRFKTLLIAIFISILNLMEVKGLSQVIFDVYLHFAPNKYFHESLSDSKHDFLLSLNLNILI